MKIKVTFFLISGLVLLTGCHSAPSLRMLDGATALVVSVEGDALASLQKRADTGETMHRVVESSDRKEVLFAYDIDVRRGAKAGSWTFLLKPSTQQPTFEKAREVTVQSYEEMVRVELLEQPETGQKIVDVFQLGSAGPRNDNVNLTDPKAHLVKFHNMVYNFLNGK
jgi:hypothetical protein